MNPCIQTRTRSPEHRSPPVQHQCFGSKTASESSTARLARSGIQARDAMSVRMRGRRIHPAMPNSRRDIAASATIEPTGSTSGRDCLPRGC